MNNQPHICEIYISAIPVARKPNVDSIQANIFGWLAELAGVLEPLFAGGVEDASATTAPRLIVSNHLKVCVVEYIPLLVVVIAELLDMIDVQALTRVALLVKIDSFDAREEALG